jgi:hypothetical protein
MSNDFAMYTAVVDVIVAAVDDFAIYTAVVDVIVARANEEFAVLLAVILLLLLSLPIILQFLQLAW